MASSLFVIGRLHAGTMLTIRFINKAIDGIRIAAQRTVSGFGLFSQLHGDFAASMGNQWKKSQYTK